MQAGNRRCVPGKTLAGFRRGRFRCARREEESSVGERGRGKPLSYLNSCFTARAFIKSRAKAFLLIHLPLCPSSTIWFRFIWKFWNNFYYVLGDECLTKARVSRDKHRAWKISRTFDPSSYIVEVHSVYTLLPEIQHLRRLVAAWPRRYNPVHTLVTIH